MGRQTPTSANVAGRDRIEDDWRDIELLASQMATETERAAGIEQLGSGDLTKKTEDLQFALVNKLEFLFK